MALGLHLFGPVDLVLSGVNLGSNLGHEIWHSGTVAAAKQGYLFGLRRGLQRALNGEVPDFAGLRPWLLRTLETLLRLERPFLVNVNLPLRPKGFLWTRQSVRAYEGVVIPGEDPMGRPFYWFAPRPSRRRRRGRTAGRWPRASSPPRPSAWTSPTKPGSSPPWPMISVLIPTRGGPGLCGRPFHFPARRATATG